MATRVEDDAVSFAPWVGHSLDLARFSENTFGRVVMVDTPDMKVVLLAFQQGQEIPPHAPEVNLTISVLDGDGQIRIDDEVFDVRSGDVAVVPAGAVRGVRGGEKGMIVLHVAAPPPSGDHQAMSNDFPWPEQAATGARISEEVSLEHRSLRPSIELLGDLADSVKMLDAADRKVALNETVEFLTNHLLPHASAEEVELYPAAERVLRARGGAVETMTIGHQAISGLVEELSQAANDDDIDSLPRILHSLRAIVLLHLDEEEKVYLPALAGLSAAEASAIAANLGLHDV